MDSHLLVVAVAVIVAAGVIYGPLKRILKVLFLRGVVRSALSHVGEQALAKQPEKIRLGPVSPAPWKDEAVIRKQASPLAPLGFVELGTFSVDRMPGVLVRMLFQPQIAVAAHIFEHPKAGSWIEFATRYTDGSSHYLATSPATGLDMPEWVRTIRADKSTPTDELYRQFVAQRQAGGIKPTSAADVVGEFEDAYMRFMIWKNNRGITPEEVAKAMVKWAEKKQAASAQ